MKNGVYTTRAPSWGGAAGFPTTSTDGSALASRQPLGIRPRLRELGLSGGLDVAGGNVSARASATGLVGLLALLAGVWAVDRYVMPIPGVGGGT